MARNSENITFMHVNHIKDQFDLIVSSLTDESKIVDSEQYLYIKSRSKIVLYVPFAGIPLNGDLVLKLG